MSTISFTMQLKLIRKSEGSYDGHGRYQEGTITESIINGSVQPATQKELLNLPEGQRIQGAVKLYTDEEVKIGDRIEYKGVQYEVHIAEDYSAFFLPHYKSIVAKAPANESERKAV